MLGLTKILKVLILLLAGVSSFNIFKVVNNWRRTIFVTEPYASDKYYTIIEQIAEISLNNSKASEKNTKDINKLIKSISELTNYNQNRDAYLEDNTAVSLKRFITDSLAVPGKKFFQYPLKNIYIILRQAKKHRNGMQFF